MITEVLQTIACGLVFGVVLIVIDTYFTNRKKNREKSSTDDGGSIAPL